MNKPKSKMVRMEAQALRIHPNAQRDLVPSRVKKLMDTLDLDAVGVFHAVQYEISGGGLGPWVVDGQHRLAALMRHGFGEWVVDVKLHLDVTNDAEAAALFLKLNDRSPVSSFDKFNNEVTACNETACGVLKQVTARGIKIAREPGDGKVRCVTAMQRVYGFDGGFALARTLDTILGAWGRTEAALDGKIVEGLGIVFNTYGDAVDHAALVKKLAKHAGGASGVLGDARAMRSHRNAPVPRCVAEVVVDLYNVGRRSGKLDPL